MSRVAHTLQRRSGTCRRRQIQVYLLLPLAGECTGLSAHGVVDSRPCPNCSDGCVVAVYCDGCCESLCRSCWQEHNEDEPDHESPSQRRGSG